MMYKNINKLFCPLNHLLNVLFETINSNTYLKFLRQINGFLGLVFWILFLNFIFII